MKAFVHPADLSQTEHVAAIEAGFALVGYARYVKVLELLAGADDHQVTMDWPGWAAQLAAQHDQAVEFLTFCDARGALVLEEQGEAVTLRCADLVPYSVAPPTPMPSDDTLFTTPEQWAEWFIADLSYPPSIAHEPEHLRQFARWCASRVTVGDMSEAVQVSIAKAEGLNIAALHRQLSALRKQRLEEAAGCF